MRLLSRAVLVAVIVVVIVVVGAVAYIDRIADAAIERGATAALGVDTELSSVSLGLLSGDFGLSGLRVANPPGFESPHFMRLGQGELKLPLTTLLDDPVVVPRLALSGIEVSLERSKGRMNYAVILSNLSGPSKDAPSAEPESGEGRGFIIQELVIRDVKAHGKLDAMGAKLSEFDVEVPEIRLRDIGSASGAGIPIEELVGVVTKAILQAVAGSRLPGDLTRELRGNLAQLGTVGIEVPTSLSELEGQLDSEAQRNLLKGVGGLLQKKKPGP
jgi:hypothetical protein